MHVVMLDNLTFSGKGLKHNKYTSHRYRQGVMTNHTEGTTGKEFLSVTIIIHVLGTFCYSDHLPTMTMIVVSAITS